jgi:hypothetical protein
LREAAEKGTAAGGDAAAALFAWLREVVVHVCRQPVLREAFMADCRGPAGIEPPQVSTVKAGRSQ